MDILVFLKLIGAKFKIKFKMVFFGEIYLDNYSIFLNNKKEIVYIFMFFLELSVIENDLFLLYYDNKNQIWFLSDTFPFHAK
jgi:hypothetical protein